LWQRRRDHNILKNYTEYSLLGLPGSKRKIIGQAKQNYRLLFAEIIIPLAKFAQFGEHLAKHEKIQTYKIM
jgi:hypothetical protein